MKLIFALLVLSSSVFADTFPTHFGRLTLFPNATCTAAEKAATIKTITDICYEAIHAYEASEKTSCTFEKVSLSVCRATCTDSDLKLKIKSNCISNKARITKTIEII